MSDTDLDLGFTAEVRTKPEGGKVQPHEVPEALAKYLAEHYKEVLDSQDKDIVLKTASKSAATRLAMYSAVWGRNHDPKLYIKKLPNGKQYADNFCRLSVILDKDVPPENRPGRRK